jgi:bifunctional ADP-heptose synthase (sugar kinase/adenylyltransferase)
LGDFCVDFYWDVNSNQTEKSLETGLMATKALNPRYSLGGAGNVVQNLLGLSNYYNLPVCFGAISNDPFGLWMKQNLPNNENIIISQNYHTAVYCKPIINNIEQPRIDFGNIELSNKDADKLLNKIVNNLRNIDILIINQQLKKGIHTEYFRTGLSEIILCYENKKCIITDARENLECYVGSIFKINSKAASMFAFNELGHSAMESGKCIFEKTGRPLVITDSINGSYVFEKNNIINIPAIIYNGKIDAIGAGDTFTAGFAYALSCNASLIEAAEFANCCSAITVRKLHQTGFPTKNELINLLEEINE